MLGAVGLALNALPFGGRDLHLQHVLRITPTVPHSINASIRPIQQPEYAQRARCLGTANATLDHVAVGVQVYVPAMLNVLISVAILFQDVFLDHVRSHV